MDHSGHGMDDHSGHGGMEPPRCGMNMLWNSQIIDTCVVFPSWHIRSMSGFVWSCIAIVAIGTLDTRIALALVASGKAKRPASGIRSGRSSPSEEDAALLTGRRMFQIPSVGTPVPTTLRLLRAAVYGVTVLISFFLMLIAMTYNVYLIFATVLGAALGHIIFNGTINIDALLSEEAKGVCH
ncbi:Ctr copper transporter family-domain-containing protein [Roridomyces roridus]|uniref:Copper transport protein n=1 Tax=Roridomyces roridus TaxID=1738132 RepID=A0AAD7G090_9AGAR|nr:Ctr copper transporter family-domain-containing protein [Roridomyces roridus]